MRTALALLAAAIVLSGCSGSGGNAPPPSVHPESTSSAGPPPPPAPTSDTLHLLAQPQMATALPSGSSEVATPVGFGGGAGAPGGPQTPAAHWSYLVTSSTNVTGGEAHLWVNIKEQLIITSNPAQPQCSWQLTVHVGSDNQALTPCINEQAGVVQPGIKELVFPLTIDSPIQTERNETVLLSLTRAGFSLSTNNAVDLLSGSSDHDSRLILKGLHEPLATA